ncbi:HAMP domain-containing sensor histidine kinase [Clostridium sp. AM58-1XD]|uniref:sensor histidine kinase n=1 Tax=Clostridium sp. AM58-1XD TaxID=2292307 RepID=UPI000E51D32E|nr:HAMP domain-containing sensor histidine kinase [Clostridium sp. AM58-1XD]RGY97956.1 sensor histidine kinase [Clostridium sp. AM58-1XD]
MKNKMVWKLTACFAAVLLLFTVVLGTVFISIFRRHTIAMNRSSMEEKAVSIAENLAAYNTDGMVRGHGGMKGHKNMSGHGGYLDFLNDLTMAEVWIVDENRNLLTMEHCSYTSCAELPDHAKEMVKRIFDGEITYGEEFSGPLDGPTLTVGVPVRTANGISGAVLLHSPVSGINDAVFQGLFTLVIGAAAALLLAGAAAVWLSYRFTAPLRRMKAAAMCLADGDYRAQTGVRQNDEIGQLAQTIDLLSGRLAQAEKEREALDQLKQNFVANVSHELRTPVAVLRGSLEVLRDGTVSEPEEVSDYYDQMLSESRHLERLVNDLLDLSRLQDAQFCLDMGEVNLCDVVRDTARAIRRPAQEKNLKLSVCCPEEACMIQGDYSRIRQLFLILLDNAVKFSQEGGDVELALVKGGNGFEAMVTDYGEGIAPEELPHIFDRFRKTHDPRNKTGTGLGLAIARQIADRHNAKISVESRDGKTCFTIHF